MRNYSFLKTQNDNPLRGKWLSRFFFNRDKLFLSDSDLMDMEKKISLYGKNMDIELRDKLIAGSEYFGTVAISKAEKTNRIGAERIRHLGAVLKANPDAVYIPQDTGRNKEIKKEHDNLEYFNILKVYRAVTRDSLLLNKLSIDYLRDLHRKLTEGLDAFKNKLEDFDPYNSGRLRNDNNVVIGDWKPAPFDKIKSELNNLINFYKSDPTLMNLNIFTTALYVIHPFSNGNKRVCRILEHGLMRGLGFGGPDIYTHLGYYYKNIDRFYSRVNQTIKTETFNPMVNINREAIFFSQLSVIEYAVRQKRLDFIKEREPFNPLRGMVFKVFVENKAVQYKNIVKDIKTVPERTLNEILKYGVGNGILAKTEFGKTTFYKLNLNTEEELFVKDCLERYKDTIVFVPEYLKNNIYAPTESWKADILPTSKSVTKQRR